MDVLWHFIVDMDSSFFWKPSLWSLCWVLCNHLTNSLKGGRRRKKKNSTGQKSLEKWHRRGLSPFSVRNSLTSYVDLFHFGLFFFLFFFFFSLLWLFISVNFGTSIPNHQTMIIILEIIRALFGRNLAVVSINWNSTCQLVFIKIQKLKLNWGASMLTQNNWYSIK